MNRLIATSLAALVLTTIAACGGDDSSSGTTRNAVLDQVIAEAENGGATVDRGCAEAAIAKLSDKDASAILAAGVDGDPDVSEDAMAVANELFGCMNFDGVVDSVLDGSLPDVSLPDVSLPDVSIPEGIEVTDEMIDMIVTSIEQSGAKVDRDCIADAIQGVDLAELAGQAGTMSPEFIQRFIGCVTP